MLFVEGLQTEYDSETEDEVSDPEPQPERGEITVCKEAVDSHYFLKEELGRFVICLLINLSLKIPFCF